MRAGYFSSPFVVAGLDLKLLNLFMVSDVRKQHPSMKCKCFDVHKLFSLMITFIATSASVEHKTGNNVLCRDGGSGLCIIMLLDILFPKLSLSRKIMLSVLQGLVECCATGYQTASVRSGPLFIFDCPVGCVTLRVQP